ncbi:MAG: hypothetical protein EXQ57_01545, partial [Bryobacterales bacterium]|nr:hypothetical protein [Bryobacterales bacterium]
MAGYLLVNANKKRSATALPPIFATLLYVLPNFSLYDIDPGPDCPEIVRVIIEIPKNSANKIEYDDKL